MSSTDTGAQASDKALDLKNVQGDILAGLPKKVQTYLFFRIVSASSFRVQLADFVPLVTTTEDVSEHRKKIDEHKKCERQGLVKLAGVGIAFSHAGLVKMGITDDIQDALFTAGEKNSGKPSDSPSAEAFRQGVHGVILVSGDSHASVDETVEKVEKIFRVRRQNAGMEVILSDRGEVRPGKEKGHEHFGFLDGISQPAVEGFDTRPNPGQETVRQGVILLGRDGDAVASKRPTWAVDGSFLVYQHYEQLVPEFNDFLEKNPIVLPGLSREKGSKLLGARMVGRWKSGAPVDLAPLEDDPEMGQDPLRNNDFRYQGEQNSQTRCPFAAHLRKTNPRADTEDLNPSVSNESHRIIRRGIQFGPEVTREERKEAKTRHKRGLLFACYQSSIANGFDFVLQKWSNNAAFPPPPGYTPKKIPPGLDPIIGQDATGGDRVMNGTNPEAQDANLTVPDFVVQAGGEYLFAPSVSALRDMFAEGVHVV